MFPSFSAEHLSCFEQPLGLEMSALRPRNFPPALAKLMT